MQLTREHLETGLRGVPVGYCTTSSVDPERGLFYVGEPIAAIAHRDPEDVIFLLLNKAWPDEAQKHAFRQQLADRRQVDPVLFTSLKALPRHGHPMKWLVHAVNVLGMVDNHGGDYRAAALALIARVPVVVAAILRIREGWGDPIMPRDDLGWIENFVHMLGIPGHGAEERARLVRLLRVFAVVHFDHGGGNLSTFTGKAVASGRADLYESMAAAMAALAGPLHGRANQECLAFVEECVGRVGGALTPAAVRALIAQKLAAREIIYGFGHAVLRVEDPRARVLRALAEELCPDDTNVRMCALLAEVAPPLLRATGKISDPFPNVDAISGSLLMACGLTNPEYYTVLFGLARTVGIAAQIVYERCEARGGRGTPIIRPTYFYSAQGTAKGTAVILSLG